MQVYVGALVGLAGVLCIVAGVKGRGTDLFSAVTGVGVGSGASSGTAPSSYSTPGGSAGAPAQTVTLPASGASSSLGAVRFA